MITYIIFIKKKKQKQYEYNRTQFYSSILNGTQREPNLVSSPPLTSED